MDTPLLVHISSFGNLMFSKRKKKKDKTITRSPSAPTLSKPGTRLTSFGVEEKLLHIWRTPITQLPVFKDLPRLVRRIEVIVTDEAKEQPQQIVEETMRTYNVWLNSHLPLNETNRFNARTWSDDWRIVTLIISEKVTQDNSTATFLDIHEDDELVCSVPISQVYTVSDSTRYFVIQTMEEGVAEYSGIAFNIRSESIAFIKALEECGRKREELLKKLEEEEIVAPPSVEAPATTVHFLQNVGVSKRDLKDPDVAKAIFASASHFLKNVYEENNKNKEMEDKEKKIAEDRRKQLEAVKTVMWQVAQYMEDEDRLEMIENGLDEVAQSTFKGDFEVLMGNLFNETIGHDSKTARVFKMINQSVIFVPVAVLKTEITKNYLMTKDDTSSDGWRIRIVIDKETVTITHIRKELPLATVKADEKQFWFRWELVMLFDRQMCDLLNAELRITELHFDEGINPALKHTLNTILNEGNLVIG